jgi:eukaryotic-like serine/threonine-protein kinase
MIGPATYLWSADGNYQIDASGKGGWDASGYEPVDLGYAQAALAKFGVNVGTITYEYSALVPVGYVITGFVPYLSSAYAGEYINLVVSNGPAPPTELATVPNVVGMFYYDAQLTILDVGLQIAPPIPALSTTVLPQYVISQSIPAGTQVAEQTQVTIVVSGFTVLQQPGIPTPVL